MSHPVSIEQPAHIVQTNIRPVQKWQTSMAKALLKENQKLQKFPREHAPLTLSKANVPFVLRELKGHSPYFPLKGIGISEMSTGVCSWFVKSSLLPAKMTIYCTSLSLTGILLGHCSHSLRNSWQNHLPTLIIKPLQNFATTLILEL